MPLHPREAGEEPLVKEVNKGANAVHVQPSALLNTHHNTISQHPIKTTQLSSHNGNIPSPSPQRTGNLSRKRWVLPRNGTWLDQLFLHTFCFPLWYQYWPIAQPLLPLHGKRVSYGAKHRANIASLLRHLHNLLIKFWNGKITAVKVLNIAAGAWFSWKNTSPPQTCGSTRRDVSTPVRKHTAGAKLTTGLIWHSPAHFVCCEGRLRTPPGSSSAVTDRGQTLLARQLSWKPSSRSSTNSWAWIL